MEQTIFTATIDEKSSSLVLTTDGKITVIKNTIVPEYERAKNLFSNEITIK